MTTRLLVSVRNAEEAAIAVDGGAEIIDVKEPNRGSLGFAGLTAIDSVLRTVAGRCQVSAAMGECTDWLTENSPLDAALPKEAVIPMLQYVKLGLSRLVLRDNAGKHDDTSSTGSSSGSDWINKWNGARDKVSTSHDHSPAWIAVSYADYAETGTPTPEEIIDAAAECCTGFLIDTFRKDGPGTPDLLSDQRLLHLRELAAGAGLMFALAGKITQHHLPLVKRINPDVLAVRGAVCDRGDRTSIVSLTKVRNLRLALSSDSAQPDSAIIAAP